LYYGILAVGFVLVLISSILCNVCINHKCKKVGVKISQNDERVVPTGPTHEIEDVFSQYETIDENNMEPMQVIEKVEGTDISLREIPVVILHWIYLSSHIALTG
jgi:hypothetical protein